VPGAGQAQPGDGDRGAHRQLPLSTSDRTPAWPCLYLTAQRHVPCERPRCLAVEMMNGLAFLEENPARARMTKMG